MVMIFKCAFMGLFVSSVVLCAFTPIIAGLVALGVLDYIWLKGLLISVASGIVGSIWILVLEAIAYVCMKLWESL